VGNRQTRETVRLPDPLPSSDDLKTTSEGTTFAKSAETAASTAETEQIDCRFPIIGNRPPRERHSSKLLEFGSRAAQGQRAIVAALIERYKLYQRSTRELARDTDLK
jgi:hypothetical protein